MAYALQAPWPQQPVAGWGGGQTGTGPGGRAEFATPAYPQQTPWPHAPQQPVWGGQPWTGPGGGAAFATPAYSQQATHEAAQAARALVLARRKGHLFYLLIMIAICFIPLGIGGVLPMAVGWAVGGISAFGALLLYGTTRREGGRGNGGDGGGAGGACGGGGCGDALICMPCAWHGMRVSRVLSVCVYVCM